MVDHCSCCTCDNQAKFNANRLVSLWLSFVKKKKLEVMVERKIVFAFLSMWNSGHVVCLWGFVIYLWLDWVLNSSRFLRCLSIALQTNASNFLPFFGFVITKKDFPWISLQENLLTNQMEAKLQGLEPRVHISQLKKGLLDIWSCADTGDLWIKLTRKRGSWRWCRLLSLMTLGQDFPL